MHYSKKIPLEQDKIQLMIKSFEDGEYEYYENFKEHPTVTRNGKGATIWNHIYTQLTNNFSDSRFKTGIIPRGPWELVYVFDNKTKYLYTFMRNQNFINLHKGNMLNRLYHYSNLLSRLNGELLGTYEPEYKQMSFINEVSIDSETDTKLESAFQEMISAIDDQIERYAIVLVDFNNGEVKNIECVIPIAYMNPMYREEWKQYIRAEYDTTEYHIDETKPSDDEILLYTNNKDIDLSFNTKEKEAAK